MLIKNIIIFLLSLIKENLFYICFEKEWDVFTLDCTLQSTFKREVADVQYIYNNIPKYPETQRIAVSVLKFEQCGSIIVIWVCRHWSDSSLIWVYTVCQTYLSENFGLLWYVLQESAIAVSEGRYM